MMPHGYNFTSGKTFPSPWLLGFTIPGTPQRLPDFGLGRQLPACVPLPERGGPAFPAPLPAPQRQEPVPGQAPGSELDTH